MQDYRFITSERWLFVFKDKVLGKQCEEKKIREYMDEGDED